jgi:hypothetical protein
VLLVRGPGPATGQVLHGLLDTGDARSTSSRYNRPATIWPPVTSNSVTPRISKACPSLRVPDQRHSVQVLSPSWTDRQIPAQKPGIPASMASQLASIWAHRQRRSAAPRASAMSKPNHRK